MTIVPLTIGNVVNATQLAQEMHRLTAYAQEGPPFDWTYMRNSFTAMVHAPNQFCMLAQDEQGEYIGGVMGRVEPHFFSPELLGIEEAWYVREGVLNRAKTAMELMRAFVHWAITIKGCKSWCNRVTLQRSIRWLWMHCISVLASHDTDQSTSL